MKKQREIVKARMLLLKNHFKHKRTGLEAMKDEIDDLATRMTTEFMKEVQGKCCKK